MKRRFAALLTFFALLSCLLFSVSAYASDSYSTISSVKIVVDSSVKDLKAGDSWPDIASLVSGGDTSEEKYTVDDVSWYDNNTSDEIHVGDTAKVVVSLSSGYKTKSNGDDLIYRFASSYSSSNVRITNGTFVSATRNGYYNLEVVFEITPVKGDYDIAENLTWSAGSLGYAAWEAPDNTSGYYDVTLYRDTKKVVTITTNSLSLNLYPWMTEAGEYTFSVTTIPYTTDQKKYGKKSDAAESENLSITESNRSNGSGQYDTTQISAAASSTGSSSGSTSTGSSSSQTTNGNVGWYQSNGSWYFRYPNQQPIVSDWLSWNDKWYHFNSQGQMETGWFKSSSGFWYYLDPTNGYAKTGWQKIDDAWYYFNPTKDSLEGSMYQNSISQIGSDKYCFDTDGKMKTGWVTQKDSSGNEAYYYFYEDGRMAKSTTISGFQLDADGKWVH